MRPSVYNRPLPRMSNQPAAISAMIVKRIKARRRRLVDEAYWVETKQDLHLERAFERKVHEGTPDWVLDPESATGQRVFERQKEQWCT